LTSDTIRWKVKLKRKKYSREDVMRLTATSTIHVGASRFILEMRHGD